MSIDESFKIMVLPGDGIGPEVTREALRVLDCLAQREGKSLEIAEALVGGACIEAHGEPILTETLEQARQADAVLLGAVGGPQWDTRPHGQRPEQALLKLRSGLELFANLRPVQVFEALVDSSTLRPEVIRKVDLVVVRELTGGIYFGEPRGIEGEGEQRRAFNTLVYREEEVRRVCKRAFEIAQKRRKNVVSVDKANILESSILWREVVEEMAKDYPDVTLSHMYVDNCAMQLVRNPGQFDVIVTNNMFGDILSDEAAMLTGSIGMLPSASIGSLSNGHGLPLGLYEPVHGSAPDIAGQGKANPLACILSVAMLMRYSLDWDDGAAQVEAAVRDILAAGCRTADLAHGEEAFVSTTEVGDLILERLV